MAELPKEHVVKVRAGLDNAIVVRPGDKLVVGLADISLASHDVDRAKAWIGKQLPGIEIVVIPGATAFAAQRQDDAELALQRISARLADSADSDEALSAGWLRGVIAGHG